MGVILPFAPTTHHLHPEVVIQYLGLARRHAQLALCLRPHTCSPRREGGLLTKRWQDAKQMKSSFPASIHRAEVIGKAPQSTWCYFGDRQRKNQKPDPFPLCLEIFLPDIVSLVFIMARPGYQGAKELALLPRKEDERDAGA